MQSQGRRYRHHWVVPLLWTLCGVAQADTVARFDLGPPLVTPESASMDVLLTLSGSASDLVDAMAIGVFDSDLTEANTDFSRFAFEPDPSTFAHWDLFGGLIEQVGVETYVALNASATALVPSASAYRLGALSVDLTAVPPGESVTITLAGGELSLATNTDVGGMANNLFAPSFALDEGAGDLAFIEFGAPSTFETFVPEPAGAAILLLVLSCLSRRVQQVPR